MKKTIGVSGLVVLVLVTVWYRAQHPPVVSEEPPRPVRPVQGSRPKAPVSVAEAGAGSASVGASERRVRAASGGVGSGFSAARLRSGGSGRGVGSGMGAGKAVAKVTAGGQEVAVGVNEMGWFDRVYVEPQQVVSVSVAYPQAAVGETVVVQVEDGGALDNGTVVESVRVDEQRRIGFAFKVSAERGIHRVVLRRGVEKKVLDFWAGEELPVAQR